MHLVIDKEQYMVFKDNQGISLPRKEFELLRLLSLRPGVVHTRYEIFEKIWGRSESNERTVDVHIVNIRKKVGSEIIKTIKGVGYKMPHDQVFVKDIE
jgi:two-component system alkaline phosphatase synthesis response regulator PhoP